MRYLLYMNKKNKRIKKTNSTVSSRTKKEQNQIVPIKEKVKRVTLSSSTIKNLETTPLKEPNALTITPLLTNNDKIHKRTRKKLGDGSFIAAEDR